MKKIDTLKVGVRTLPAALAGTIFHLFASDDSISLKAKAFGKTASHNMFKGIAKEIKANGYNSSSKTICNKVLIMRVSFSSE